MTAGDVSAPIRVLVVDDERIARQSLLSLLAADPEVRVVGECASGPQAVEALRQHPVDVLFLDVEMAGMDGFQVLRQAGPELSAAIIFVTAYDTHALKAFEVHALDYLLKPFDDERFARVLARAKEHVRNGRIQTLARQLAGLLGAAPPPPAAAPVTPPPEPPRYLERLVLKDVGRVAFVNVEEVDWLEAEDYYIQVHTAGQTHLIRQSLRELETQLDPRRFVRIHRSTIVNVERVKELRPLFHGEYHVILRDGNQLKLSRSYRARLDALLGRK
ncbi:LytR/AlgR family response regulator transcription factor [Stigmatella aurantiaca]|uniref:Two component transcriptional regulator, LytTR family n=1 Tax=Stigmatella aurantiaca (strain DW4/3-1) TaxID=378806 RepID=E3FWF0_STIAD|nr:LytTR family DNA-binding domain-containing protein [Stigmatella aurantiaca]ADO76056.1 Two component transcriptional regulator, LytTR family [Stigmatella aurantiaca DW4/3-1]